MKLGHLSDIHIFAMDRFNPLNFLNKRIVGGLNLLLHRGKSQSSEIVEEAFRLLASNNVDHYVISGDLTNLALDSEFTAAAQILARVDDAEHRVSVVPGNHDYYTRDATSERRFETHFAPYLISDLPDYQLDSGYPFCKLRDDVAIIGLCSGTPSPWLFATGKVRREELHNARMLLEDPLVRDRFKVVVIHHHLIPFEHGKIEYNRRLINARDVLNMVRQHNVDLVLHGHNHHYSIVELPHLRGPGKVRICDVGSAAQKEFDDPHFGGKFNIYHIENKRLTKVETHLFDKDESTFKPWKERVFEETL